MTNVRARLLDGDRFQALGSLSRRHGSEHRPRKNYPDAGAYFDSAGRCRVSHFMSCTPLGATRIGPVNTEPSALVTTTSVASLTSRRSTPDCRNGPKKRMDSGLVQLKRIRLPKLRTPEIDPGIPPSAITWMHPAVREIGSTTISITRWLPFERMARTPHLPPPNARKTDSITDRTRGYLGDICTSEPKRASDLMSRRFSSSLRMRHRCAPSPRHSTHRYHGFAPTT